VALETAAGGLLEIYEDDNGVWLRDGSWHECLAPGALALPDFDGHRHAAALRALHHEILVNIVDGRPLPNLLTHAKPSHRVAAVAAMVLARTGHLALVRDWILALREPCDRANRGRDAEPDNLGQALYLISLVGGASHPLVSAVLTEADRFRRGDYLCGPTDGAEHPVYQTKWLRFGLRALGLPDATWRVPAMADSYAARFWLDRNDPKRERAWPGAGFDEAARSRAPAFGVAEDHGHGLAPPAQALTRAPLTWMAHAPDAHHRGMRLVAPAYAEARLVMPHAGHAAELFLWLWENP
jgi:hypothetical protein